MFLKLGKNLSLVNFSIRSKISFGTGLASLAVLLLMVALFYWAVFEVMETASEQFILDEIRTLSLLLTKQPIDKDALYQEISLMNTTRTKHSSERVFLYYIELLDENNQQVAITPRMHDELKRAPYSTPIQLSEVSKKKIYWKNDEGDTYILAKISLSTAGKSWTVNVALDISYQDEVLSTLFWKYLIPLLCLGVILTVVLSFWVGRASTRRIEDITNTAKMISGESLNARLDVNDWPAELYSLVVAINAMLERIENAFARLSQFSSTLAHEFRTPLSNLMGEIEVTLSRDRSVEDYLKTLESNLEECQRLTSLVDNILFLSRSSELQQNHKCTPCDIKSEVQKIADYYQVLADEKQIKFEVQGNGLCYCEPSLMQQAISNIICNAIYYTPAQGNINVEIFAVEDKISIQISDNGIGISADDISHVFDRFYRVNNSSANHPKGQGLGLAIAKHIIESQNGQISVCSQLHQGTVFTILLPRAA